MKLDTICGIENESWRNLICCVLIWVDEQSAKQFISKLLMKCIILKGNLQETGPDHELRHWIFPGFESNAGTFLLVPERHIQYIETCFLQHMWRMCTILPVRAFANWSMQDEYYWFLNIAFNNHVQTSFLKQHVQVLHVHYAVFAVPVRIARRRIIDIDSSRLH